MRAIVVPLCAALVLIAAPVAARSGALSVGSNLIKPALGLPNLELEVGLQPRLSLALFGEALLYRTPLTPPVGMHPDAVLRVGPRYYAYSFQPELPSTGFYVGLSAGATWYSNATNATPLTAGVELGYKHVFFEHLCVQPRALLTHAVNSTAITPGLELLVGGTW